MPEWERSSIPLARLAALLDCVSSDTDASDVMRGPLPGPACSNHVPDGSTDS